MSDWASFTIGELGCVVTGRTPPSSHPELFIGDIPFLTPTDIDGEHRHIHSERNVSQLWDRQQSKISLPPNSVCVVCIGATIGKVCLTSRRSQSNQQINSIIVDERRFDPQFVYYTIRLIKDELRKRATGAATPIINKSVFSSISVRVPPLASQRRISFIVGAYDDLIEVNRRRIALLEEMVQRVFDEWFIRRRFPNHESASDTMQRIKSLPGGWQPTTVRQLVDRRKSGRVYRSADCENAGSIVVIDQSTSEILGYHSNVADHDASPNAPVVIFGDHTCKMEFMVGPFSLGPNTVAFTAKPTTNIYFVFSLIRGLTRTREYKRHWNELMKNEVVTVPKALADAYAEKVQPFFQLQDNLRRQNRGLAASRDLLLPRLVSGELSVSAVVRELEAVA